MRGDHTASACFEREYLVSKSSIQCTGSSARLPVTETFLDTLNNGASSQPRTYNTKFLNIHEHGVSIVEKPVEIGFLQPWENKGKSSRDDSLLIFCSEIYGESSEFGFKAE